MKRSVLSEVRSLQKAKSQSKSKGFGKSSQSQKNLTDQEWDEKTIQEYLEKNFEDMRAELPPDDVDSVWAIIPTLEEPGENLGRPIPGNSFWIFWSEDYEEAANYERTHKNCFLLPMVRAEENPGSWRAAIY